MPWNPWGPRGGSGRGPERSGAPAPARPPPGPPAEPRPPLSSGVPPSPPPARPQFATLTEDDLLDQCSRQTLPPPIPVADFVRQMMQQVEEQNETPTVPPPSPIVDAEAASVPAARARPGSGPDGALSGLKPRPGSGPDGSLSGLKLRAPLGLGHVQAGSNDRPTPPAPAALIPRAPSEPDPFDDLEVDLAAPASNAAPADLAPEDVVSEDWAPEDAAPEDAAPEDVAPEVVELDVLAEGAESDLLDEIGATYLSRLGGRTHTPFTVMTPEEALKVPLDHWAGFVLSLIDGSTTIEQVIDASAMPEVEALRVLCDLREQGLIDVRAPQRRTVPRPTKRT